MAIVSEHFELDGRDFIRLYSDEGRYLVGGEPEGEYSEVCEPADLGRAYTEGELMPVTETDAAEILDIILGGDGE